MTTTDGTGVTIHFVRDGFTLHTGEGFRSEARVMRRGETVTIDDALRRANSGRDGVTALDRDEAEQLRTYGVVYFRPGPFPEDEDPLTPGSFEHDQARAAALAEAAQIADPDEQRIALAKVRERFGVPSEGRSRTLRTLTDHR